MMHDLKVLSQSAIDWLDEWLESQTLIEMALEQLEQKPEDIGQRLNQLLGAYLSRATFIEDELRGCLRQIAHSLSEEEKTHEWE